MKRPARLIALALALVLAIPASVLAEKKEGRIHEHVHEKNGEHEYEYEYEYEQEHEYEEEHEHKKPALPEGDRAVSPAPAVSTQSLAAAVQAVSTDPANSRATEAMRGLARGAGTGAPRLWVHGRPVQAGLLARGDQVLLPLRTTATALGATLSLDNASGVITLTRGPRQVRLTPGQASATVNGSPVALDAAPVLSGGATYVSLMTLAEALVLQVLYDPVSGLVVISDLPPTQP